MSTTLPVSTTMKAITQDRYGDADVLRLSDEPIPAVGPTEVLVRVVAAGVDIGVWHTMTGRPRLMRVIGFGFSAPKDRVRGREFAGRVDAVGAEVSSFRVGDEVFGSGDGSFAEFIVVPETALAVKPAAVSFVQAAALPISGGTALQAVQVGEVVDGCSVLVIGAGGAVGSFAVQLAEGLGARVTGVCRGTKVDLVRGLGAAEVIDYGVEDVTACGRTWDVIIDTGGNRRLGSLRRILAADGRLVLVGSEQGGAILGGMERVLAAALLSPFTKQKLIGLLSKELPEHSERLARLVVDGALVPVIEQQLPLERAGEAIEHLHRGEARGKTVLVV